MAELDEFVNLFRELNELDNSETDINELDGVDNISYDETKLIESSTNIDFDIELFHLLLCYLGFQTRDLTGSNSGLDRDEYIIPILEQRKEQLGVPINLLDFLRKAIDLNILVNDNNQYSFSHELYQEYYAAEFLMQLTKSNNG